MTETRPTIADELRFEPGQTVRIRKRGIVGLVVNVYRTVHTDAWQYIVRYRDSLGYEHDAISTADELVEWKGFH